ncbi:MAG: orotate phosphoribosyltransferase [Nanoarchaeota archaeon]|nr:orotate phosphoribosyltransferase [Nanoarchaeota archaeon]
MNEKLIEKIKKAGIIKEGNFILKSGKTSKIYFDLRKIYKHPELVDLIVSELKKKIEELKLEITAIASSGYGGIPLATILSNKTRLPLILVRDIPKDHGRKSNIDGYVPNETDKILIVDDVLASGTSIKQTVDNLKNTQAKIIGAIVVIHREEGELNIPIYCLVKVSELLK